MKEEAKQVALMVQRENGEIVSVDELVVRNMRDLGANMAEPTETNHYLYFSKRRDAVAAGNALKARGFEVFVSRGYRRDWLVLARQEIVVIDRNMELIRTAMERLAEQFDGKYDGWEALVVPNLER